ncbi:AraC-like ligand-binding domain-containing protein [Streptomyces sp. NPDC058256]|uniref:AraC-like ligand-binding domain-containing protein n=1 Tax=Streptomyces sp. NPDC058256 TaxID=3346408 RepID=UPI0036E9EA86
MVQRWSTSEAPSAAQFARWRELICEAFLALTPESDLRDGFAGAVTLWPLAALNIARIDSQRQRVQRTPHDIERAPQQGYYANFQLRGTSFMTQHGNSTVLHPGDLAVVDTAEPFAFDFRDNFRQLSLYVPKPLLENQLGAPVRTASRVDTATGIGAAIRHALLALTRDDLAEDTAARLAIHACGILAVALEQPAASRAIPIRHDRIHAAALADIDEHLTDDDLSPPATARRLGVSVRLLYAVFAAQQRSFAAEVRRRRLHTAWRGLQDPARAHLRVIDVAVDAGFTNVTSFHRAFRREYGRTPAQVRGGSAG